jgi:hypothetical protein
LTIVQDTLKASSPPALATAFKRQADVPVKFDFSKLSVEKVITKMDLFGGIEARNFVFENVKDLEDLQMALDNDFSMHLKSLSFSDGFNQCIENVEFPDGLTSLHVGEDEGCVFNHNFDNVKLPAGLTSLYMRSSTK